MERQYALKALRAFGADARANISDTQAVAELDAMKDKTGVVLTCYDPRETGTLAHHLDEHYFQFRNAGGVSGVATNDQFTADSQTQRSIVLPLQLKGRDADTIIVMGHTDCAACRETCHCAEKGDTIHNAWMPRETRSHLAAALRNGGLKKERITPEVRHSVEQLSVLQSMRNVLDYQTLDGRSVRQMVDRGELHIIGAMMDVNRTDAAGNHPISVYDPDTNAFIAVDELAKNIPVKDTALAMNNVKSSVGGFLIPRIREGIDNILKALNIGKAGSPSGQIL